MCQTQMLLAVSLWVSIADGSPSMFSVYNKMNNMMKSLVTLIENSKWVKVYTSAIQRTLEVNCKMKCCYQCDNCRPVTLCTCTFCRL